MKKIICLILVSVVTMSCGKRRTYFVLGTPGVTGQNGVSAGLDIEDLQAGSPCSTGGLRLTSFRDTNDNGLLESGESVVAIKTVCNGVAGQDGASASVTVQSVAAGFDCPTGGYTITSSSSQTVALLCNGLNGANGAQGIAGVQGIPGLQGPAGPQGPNGNNGNNGSQGAQGAQGAQGNNGSNGSNGSAGTSVTPVKFCSNDNTSFPEYGLMVGDKLFAVYWGTTPGSPNAKQAFLALITPGNYQSTGGNNCSFTIN